MKVAFDTSVLVTSLVRQHPQHGSALGAVRRVLEGRDRGYVAAHGFVETYAVLTRLPVSPRIAAETANRLVTENIAAHFDIVALTAAEYRKLVASFPELGISGGAANDAIHAACATKAGVQRLYTFNVKDFRSVAPHLEERIVSPSEGR